jgi:hypothetical protein
MNPRHMPEGTNSTPNRGGGMLVSRCTRLACGADMVHRLALGLIDAEDSDRSAPFANLMSNPGRAAWSLPCSAPVSKTGIAVKESKRAPIAPMSSGIPDTVAQ